MTERERLIEILSNIDFACDNGSNLQDRIEFIADYLLANGVVVLPCKVGDIIYEVCERRKNGEWQKVVVERVVHGVEIGINGSLAARCGTTITVYLSGLGKTVFLTREEAERALKGVKK